MEPGFLGMSFFSIFVYCDIFNFVIFRTMCFICWFPEFDKLIVCRS